MRKPCFIHSSPSESLVEVEHSRHSVLAKLVPHFLVRSWLHRLESVQGDGAGLREESATHGDHEHQEATDAKDLELKEHCVP